MCVCVCACACVLVGDFLEVEISGDTKNTTMENDLGRKKHLTLEGVILLYLILPVTSCMSIPWPS